MEAAVFTDDSPFVLFRERRGDEVHLALAALGVDGQRRWTTPLTTEHLSWHGRVARCGERVLVAYSQVIGQAYGDARLHWALLDAADGRVLRRTSAEDAPVQGFGEGIGVGCHGDGVLLVHGIPRGAAAWRIDAAGAATPTPAPPGTTWSIARDAAGSVVASTTHEGVRVAFLDAAGAETRALLVARGPTQRKPVIAAGPGDLFGVSWETYPGDTAQVTVLDAAGHVADPLPLGGGAPRRTAAIAGAPDGFVAAAVADPGTEVEGLACRTRPRGTAPARLGP
ncbi:MAG: hypothetical protein R3F43_15500 [bacterium]